ncbi:MAG: pyruvate, phosphate dikinase [Janthinobacterium lividum]
MSFTRIYWLLSDAHVMSETKPPVADRSVYSIAELDPEDGRRFGGKATGLARMAAAGIPVPPAFAISTDGFRAYRACKGRLPPELIVEIDAAIERLAAALGRPFGRAAVVSDPLLISVRSGAQVSMPGMMDTILNLGFTASSATASITHGRPRAFIIDSWMRFWKMYGDIVLGLDADEFMETVAPAVSAAQKEGADLHVLEAQVVTYIEAQGEEAPIDPLVQLHRAVAAVFASWDSPRARAYREHQKISDDLGTAVTVQAMVFGNLDALSGSGVAFSRNPNTGSPALYGEYLVGRQGEDIVSGAQTPVDLTSNDHDHLALRAELEMHARTLEKIYRDAVDIEFTLETGKLYLLQVRPAKRTAAASVQIATNLVSEGLIPPNLGIERVSRDQIKRLLRPVFSEEERSLAEIILTGIGSSPGHASGVAVLDSDRAAQRANAGEAVILFRPTTSPLDIHGMLAAQGVVTARGGALSHAAVVSRALDKPCIVGCEALDIDIVARTFTIEGKTYPEGLPVAIDGLTGEVLDRALNLIASKEASQRLAELLDHADRLSGARVWSQSLSQAQNFSVSGVGVVDIADLLPLEIPAGEQSRSMASAEVNALMLAAMKLKVEGLLRGHPQGIPIHIRLPTDKNWTSIQRKTLIAAIAQTDSAKYSPVTIIFEADELASDFADTIVTYPQISLGVSIIDEKDLAAALRVAEIGGMIWIDLAGSDGISEPSPLRSGVGVSGTLFDLLVPTDRLGVLCHNSIDIDRACDAYAEGFRVFSAPPAIKETLRLALAQTAARLVA